MAGINDAFQTQQARIASGGGFGNNLYLRDGDVALVWFIGSGDAGDPYFEQYEAHELPAVGGKRGDLRYCPRLSNIQNGGACPGTPCPLDSMKTKLRMRMWFWVEVIMRAQLPADGNSQNLQPTAFNGRQYWQENVGKPMIWDTSAWRDSCLTDIRNLFQQTGDLRRAMLMLETTGTNLTKRYKPFPWMQNGQLVGIPPQYLEKAYQTCEPIAASLVKEIGAQIAMAPAAAAAGLPSAPQWTPQWQQAPQQQQAAAPVQQQFAPQPAQQQYVSQQPQQQPQPQQQFAPQQQPQFAPASGANAAPWAPPPQATQAWTAPPQQAVPAAVAPPPAQAFAQPQNGAAQYVPQQAAQVPPAPALPPVGTPPPVVPAGDGRGML